MTIVKKNSLNCIKEISVLENRYKYFSLSEAEKNGLKGISKLPNSLKVLLENLLRFEDGITVDHNQIQSLKDWLKFKKSKAEIASGKRLWTSLISGNTGSEIRFQPAVVS